MKFRKANLSDLNNINNLHQQTFENNPLTNLKNELDSVNTKYYLATNDKLVGYISFKCVIDECDIIYFAVDKNYQNKKIGTKLLTFAINELKHDNIKSITLEVRDSNVSAIKVYESLGFNKINIRKNYYTDPKEDGLIYRWEGE